MGEAAQPARVGRPRLDPLPVPFLPGFEPPPGGAAGEPPRPADGTQARPRRRTLLQPTSPFYEGVLLASGKQAIERLGAGGDPVAVLTFALAHTGLPAIKLAEIFGCDRKTLWRWQHGEAEPEMSMVRAMLDVFGIKIALSAPRGRKRAAGATTPEAKGQGHAPEPTPDAPLVRPDAGDE